MTARLTKAEGHICKLRKEQMRRIEKMGDNSKTPTSQRIVR